MHRHNVCRMATPSEDGAVTGYLHPQYARSFSEFGRSRALPRSGGWILERSIADTDDRDAMGCYPLFACQRWSELRADVDDLGDSLVSLTLVTDPFGDYDRGALEQCFPDLAKPFKEHSVIDLGKPAEQTVDRGHRKEARRALKRLVVEVHPNPVEFLDSWMSLHRHLVKRHGIAGIAAFSRAAFEQQLTTPGCTLLWARSGDEPVAATVYLSHGGVAHGHVLACSDVGYAQGALYALIWRAIEHFTGTHQWINLMGVPGADDAGSRGIRDFKRGWTTVTRTAWLCGRIFDRHRYNRLVEATHTMASRYFPAYRENEMTRAQAAPAMSATRA